MKRGKLFACAMIVVAISLLGYGTAAYFTAEEKVHNVITTGEVKIQLQEWADQERTVPFPEEGVKGAMPGQEMGKVVEVKNTGSSPAYIRVGIERGITLQEGAVGTPDLDLVQLDINTEDWTLGEDGYYYYNEALLPDEATPALFTTVHFDSSMGNLYQNSTAVIDVTAYGVQVANNGDTVFDAAGWPAE